MGGSLAQRALTLATGGHGMVVYVEGSVGLLVVQQRQASHVRGCREGEGNCTHCHLRCGTMMATTRGLGAARMGARCSSVGASTSISREHPVVSPSRLSCGTTITLRRHHHHQHHRPVTSSPSAAPSSWVRTRSGRGLACTPVDVGTLGSVLADTYGFPGAMGLACSVLIAGLGLAVLEQSSFHMPRLEPWYVVIV